MTCCSRRCQDDPKAPSATVERSESTPGVRDCERHRISSDPGAWRTRGLPSSSPARDSRAAIKSNQRQFILPCVVYSPSLKTRCQRARRKHAKRFRSPGRTIKRIRVLEHSGPASCRTPFLEVGCTQSLGRPTRGSESEKHHLPLRIPEWAQSPQIGPHPIARWRRSRRGKKQPTRSSQ